MATVCLLAMYGCGTQRMIVQNNDVVRWPDFLRDWATDYEINDPPRMAIIDQIDTLYRLVEDSTENTSLLCEKICQTQDVISDAITHDTLMVFTLMMSAAARNFYGIIYNNPWLLELGCNCEVFDFLLIDSKWYTGVRENFDIMYTTMLGLSWQAPERFANLVLTKGDDSELATALLIVYNYTDTVIDNLQVTFTDSANNVMERITESNTYIDTPDAGVKRMMIPPYLLMNALVDNWTLMLSYDTPQGTLEMVGFPHIHFLEQVEDCPRLKAVLRGAME